MTPNSTPLVHAITSGPDDASACVSRRSATAAAPAVSFGWPQGIREAVCVDGDALRLCAGVTYHPSSSQAPLLQDVNLTLPAHSVGLVYGSSGSGKTTLLQLLAGLREQTQGVVSMTGQDGAHAGQPARRHGRG